MEFVVLGGKYLRPWIREAIEKSHVALKGNQFGEKVHKLMQTSP